MMKKELSAGFTLVEVLITVGVLSAFIAMALNYSSVMSRNAYKNRSASTQKRVLAGIRELARFPATIRSSMRASENGHVVNPQLLACAGGNPANSCQSGVEYPLTMYAPIVARDSSGHIIGVQAISAPLGSTTPIRFDSFGAPCSVAGPECALLVFTTFKAQCGPPQLSPIPAVVTADQLVPLSACTVADVIEVIYYIQLDPSVTAVNPDLTGFGTQQVKGSVIVSVLAVSGNHPQ